MIKCRSINLGYTLAPNSLKKVGISSFRFYVNVTNPFIIWAPSVKSGLVIDPEGNGYGGGVSQTSIGSGDVGAGGSAGQGRQITVNMNNPPTRQMIIGVNVKF